MRPDVVGKEYSANNLLGSSWAFSTTFLESSLSLSQWKVKEMSLKSDLV